MSDRIQGIINGKNAHEVERVITGIRALAGRGKMIRIEACLYRTRRTDRQNAFYWPCFCEPFADWMSEQYGRKVTADESHSIFKDTFLRVPQVTSDGEQIFNPYGDPMMRTRSTTELSTVEFNEYLDQCGQLLQELCGYRVPEPSVYREAVA